MSRPLTFGIEFEFAFATVPRDFNPSPSEQTDGLPLAMRSNFRPSQSTLLHEEAFDAINEVLDTFGLATVLAPLDRGTTRMGLRSHDNFRWHLTSDPTIKGPNRDYHWLQVELISPVLQLTAGGIAEAMQIASLIQRHFWVSTNDTTGMHVHIGDSTNGFTLEVCQRVMGFFYVFDPLLAPIHPPSRQEHQYARSIRDACILNRGNEWSVAETLEAIHDTNSIEQLEFGFGGRRPAVNLQNLRHGRDPNKSTIEFRQHAGTMDPARVEAWIQTVGGIVDWCRKASDKEYTELLEDSAEQQDEVYTYAPGTAAELLKVIGLDKPAAFYKKRLAKTGGREPEGELVSDEEPLSEDFVDDSSSSDSNDTADEATFSGDEDMTG